MANGLSGVFKDPERLQQLSQFLLNFGSGVATADARGLSPFASLALGFGTGGQGIQQVRKTQLAEQRLKEESEARRERLGFERRRLGLSEAAGRRAERSLAGQERSTRLADRRTAQEDIEAAALARGIGGQPAFDAGVAGVPGGASRADQLGQAIPPADLTDPAQAQRLAGQAIRGGQPGLASNLLTPPRRSPQAQVAIDEGLTPGSDAFKRRVSQLVAGKTGPGAIINVQTREGQLISGPARSKRIVTALAQGGVRVTAPPAPGTVSSELGGIASTLAGGGELSPGQQQVVETFRPQDPFAALRRNVFDQLNISGQPATAGQTPQASTAQNGNTRRTQAISEAKQAIATGTISKAEALRRMRADGIDVKASDL